jgi:uncharacterized delta-60 repeat protein
MTKEREAAMRRRMASPRVTHYGLTFAACGCLCACGGSVTHLESSFIPAEGGVDARVVPEAAPVAAQVEPDPSFGEDGNVDGELAVWTPLGVAIDAQGRVLVSGLYTEPDAPLADMILRLGTDGTLDPSFGDSGRAVLGVSPSIWSQALQSLPGGGVAVLGGASVGGEAGAFALSFTGGADSSAFPFFSTASVGAFASGLWQDDGSCFLFGTAASARVRPDGTLDASFASNGLFPGAATGAVTSDGKLWTATAGTLARYLPSGATDSSFGDSGSLDLGAGAAAGFAIQTLLAIADGGVMIVGSHPSGTSYAVDLIRLTASGDRNSGFAGAGALSVPVEGGPVGGTQLDDGRTLVWTAYGELLIVQADGSMTGPSNLQISGTVLGATADDGGRLILVGMMTADPTRSRWFVRRYLLP